MASNRNSSKFSSVDIDDFYYLIGKGIKRPQLVVYRRRKLIFIFHNNDFCCSDSLFFSTTAASLIQKTRKNNNMLPNWHLQHNFLNMP
jgi:hypothetical protein